MKRTVAPSRRSDGCVRRIECRHGASRFAFLRSLVASACRSGRLSSRRPWRWLPPLIPIRLIRPTTGRLRIPVTCGSRPITSATDGSRVRGFLMDMCTLRRITIRLRTRDTARLPRAPLSEARERAPLTAARQSGAVSITSSGRAIETALFLSCTSPATVHIRLSNGRGPLHDDDAPRSFPDWNLLRHLPRREIDHRYIV